MGVGFAYILTSDMILYALVEDPWLMSQIQSYKGIAYVILTGFMLYALSAYYFKQQKRFHETIIQREKERQKEIIHILELERNRFAVELHDNIQQQLAGIHIFLKHYRENPEEHAEVLEDIDRMLGESIRDVRNLSHDLSSLADGKIDLIQKVDDLLLKTERFSGIDFDFSHGIQREIPKFYAVNLYRIIQELVLNTVKHSDAKSSKVSLTESGNQLILIYADDGKGASSGDTDGIGMLNIRYRISSLNGSMTLGIFPNGFSMQVNLPFQSLGFSSIQ